MVLSDLPEIARLRRRIWILEGKQERWMDVAALEFLVILGLAAWIWIK